MPADPDFVVANVRQALPDEELRALLAAWRSAPESDSRPVSRSPRPYIARARALREPRYFGRAEAVLAPLAIEAGRRAPRCAACMRRCCNIATTSPPPKRCSTTVLREAPHDDDARLLRASVRLVRGDFAGARGDCAQLAAGGGSCARIGFACLAEALAGSGQLERGPGLAGQHADGSETRIRITRAYLLATRAELRERSRDLDGAIADYREALKLAPRDDSIRAALADALAARGDDR